MKITAFVAAAALAMSPMAAMAQSQPSDKDCKERAANDNPDDDCPAGVIPGEGGMAAGPFEGSNLVPSVIGLSAGMVTAGFIICAAAGCFDDDGNPIPGTSTTTTTTGTGL